MFGNLSQDWKSFLILFIIVVVVSIFFFMFVFYKTPKWLGELIDYLNLSRFGKPISEYFSYSKFFDKHKDIVWMNMYSGKDKGAEVFFGNFKSNKKTYTIMSYKEEVKPLMITSQKEDFDYNYQKDFEFNKNIWYIFSQDRYLMENVSNSVNFQSSLRDLFRGQENWLEFTDLNQIILISDYQYNNGKELIDSFVKFRQLKDNL